MGQTYLQRFEYRGAIDKSAFDNAWSIANDTMAKTGNWGGVQEGVRHIHAYGTASGGYALIEVDDTKAFEQYQLFHIQNYGHMCTITFEPLIDLDTALAPTLAEIRVKG